MDSIMIRGGEKCEIRWRIKQGSSAVLNPDAI